MSASMSDDTGPISTVDVDVSDVPVVRRGPKGKFEAPKGATVSHHLINDAIRTLRLPSIPDKKQIRDFDLDAHVAALKRVNEMMARDLPGEAVRADVERRNVAIDESARILKQWSRGEITPRSADEIRVMQQEAARREAVLRAQKQSEIAARQEGARQAAHLKLEQESLARREAEASREQQRRRREAVMDAREQLFVDSMVEIALLDERKRQMDQKIRENWSKYKDRVASGEIVPFRWTSLVEKQRSSWATEQLVKREREAARKRAVEISNEMRPERLVALRKIAERKQRDAVDWSMRAWRHLVAEWDRRAAEEQTREQIAAVPKTVPTGRRIMLKVPSVLEAEKRRVEAERRAASAAASTAVTITVPAGTTTPDVPGTAPTTVEVSIPAQVIETSEMVLRRASQRAARLRRAKATAAAAKSLVATVAQGGPAPEPEETAGLGAFGEMFTAPAQPTRAR